MIVFQSLVFIIYDILYIQTLTKHRCRLNFEKSYAPATLDYGVYEKMRKYTNALTFSNLMLLSSIELSKTSLSEKLTP